MVMGTIDTRATRHFPGILEHAQDLSPSEEASSIRQEPPPAVHRTRDRSSRCKRLLDSRHPETVRRLRTGIGGKEGRKKAYEFVDEEFRALADGAYVALDLPPVTLSNAWEIFVLVISHLRTSSVDYFS
ncbi:hypothetical protein M407DRAFT_18893 [Tulasnella calospora MUT 4182]|uniref:Uncharacterized protein n=1 Tax=Tulasnella calospora MUT 4182 TaxID=1051891 RepID=A0A0C3ME91_9AGAM|nr:hypothetical protein M407DRAFT_18893 [Tulasnella calospora MUT 4182]